MLGNRDTKILNVLGSILASVFTWGLGLWIFFAITAQAQTGTRPVWGTKHNSWLEETSPGSGETWRDRYAKWVQTDLTENIFTAPDSPLYGMNVYCSSAAISYPLLFAYLNGLPFNLPGNKGAMNNELPYCNGGESDLRCFRRFVTNVLPTVNTQVLSGQTFPVSIDRQSVKPGDILLYYSQGKNAADGRPIVDHTHTLTDVTGAGVPHFLSASSLGKPQVLTELRGIQDPPFTKGEDGIRDWWTYRYNPQTGKYSHERLEDEPSSLQYMAAHGQHYVNQYTDLDHFHWGDDFTKQLAKYSQSSTAKMIDLYKSLCDSVQQRETYVNDSDAVFSRTNQCPNSDQWERFSTVAKDERVWNLFKRIDEIVKEWRPDQYNQSGDSQFYDQESYEKIVRLRDQFYSSCKLQTVGPENHRLNLLWLRQIYKKRLASADPADAPKGSDLENGIDKRWGLGIDPSIDLSGPPPQTRYDEDWPAKYDSNYIVSYNSCPLAQGSRQRSVEDSSFEKATGSDERSNFRPLPAPVTPVPRVERLN